MDEARFRRQLDFLVEADKIKGIMRQSKLFDGSRFENDAEHSWSVCLMAFLLREYANFDVDMEKVVLMLLIHDLVEVDAGDTFLYSAQRGAAAAKEDAAAVRIFGMLEADQGGKFLAVWREFEARQTREAKFAAVFDRLEPLLQNYANEGSTWKRHGITKAMVLAKNKHVAEGSAEIWDFVLKLLDLCVERGYLAE